MENLEPKDVRGKMGREAKMPPNKDQNPTKKKGPVQEPGKAEPMILSLDPAVAKKEKHHTSTDRASGKERSSTVTDGEDG